MRTVEILKICSDMGNLQIPTHSFEEQAEALQDETVQKLLFCCNCVLEELYCDYATAVRKCNVEAVDNFVDVSNLQFNRVLSLTDLHGNNVKYRYAEHGLIVENGNYILTYAALPDEVQFDGEIVFPSPRITARIFAYGVVAEYFASVGDFTSAKLWEERYRDSLHIASIKNSAMNLPVGKWA